MNVSWRQVAVLGTLVLWAHAALLGWAHGHWLLAPPAQAAVWTVQARWVVADQANLAALEPTPLRPPAAQSPREAVAHPPVGPGAAAQASKAPSPQATPAAAQGAEGAPSGGPSLKVEWGTQATTPLAAARTSMTAQSAGEAAAHSADPHPGGTTPMALDVDPHKVTIALSPAPTLVAAQAQAATPHSVDSASPGTQALTQSVSANVSGPATASAPAHLWFDVQASKFPYRLNGELTWRHDGQHYDAELSVGALGWSRSQSSRGTLSPMGLAPLRFGDKTRAEQAAHFRRDSKRVTFSANTPDVPLLPGTQDRLSVLLQLGAWAAGQPQATRTGSTWELLVVGARDGAVWQFRVEGPQTLDLPAGRMDTLKLVRLPRELYDQKLEVWLAPSLQYLPVRVRLTEPNGDTLDQQLREHQPLPLGLPGQ